MEKDEKYWFRKRMEQIPVPRPTGEFVERTEEQHEQARRDLIKLMKESGVDTTGLE